MIYKTYFLYNVANNQLFGRLSCISELLPGNSSVTVVYCFPTFKPGSISLSPARLLGPVPVSPSFSITPICYRSCFHPWLFEGD